MSKLNNLNQDTSGCRLVTGHAKRISISPLLFKYPRLQCPNSFLQRERPEHGETLDFCLLVLLAPDSTSQPSKPFFFIAFDILTINRFETISNTKNLEDLSVGDLIHFTDSSIQNIRLGASRWKERVNYAYGESRRLEPIGSDDWVNTIIPFEVIQKTPTFKVKRLSDKVLFRLPKKSRNYAFYFFTLNRISKPTEKRRG